MLERDHTIKDQLADTLYQLVKDDVYNPIGSRPNKEPTARVVVMASREIKGNSRLRIRWTEAEDAILIEGREKGESWVDIAEKIEGRTNDDCRGRYRNIMKKRSLE